MQPHADEESERKAFLVRFESGDPEDPYNFSPGRKMAVLIQMSFLGLVGALGTSIMAPAETAIAKYTDTSTEVTTLVLSLYVLGRTAPLILSRHYDEALTAYRIRRRAPSMGACK